MVGCLRVQTYSSNLPQISDLRVADASDALIKQSMQQAGLDSLSALDLRNAIAETFLVDLPAAAAFDFPSIAALANHILLLKEPLCAAPEQLAVSHSASRADALCCAFLGVGCIFPDSSSREGASPQRILHRDKHRNLTITT